MNVAASAVFGREKLAANQIAPAWKFETPDTATSLARSPDVELRMLIVTLGESQFISG